MSTKDSASQYHLDDECLVNACVQTTNVCDNEQDTDSDMIDDAVSVIEDALFERRIQNFYPLLGQRFVIAFMILSAGFIIGNSK